MPSQIAGRPPNRLVDSTSPYLLQHAYNPVDWNPWGEEALARARAEDTPILLSIGYSACHWCHVMERESFEDPSIAALMNEHFVPVKVDREERPDLDDVYMSATLAMNEGHGGWPMTVFLTPDLLPFFAGTYFPPEDRWGRPGLRNVLVRLAELWRSDRSRLAERGAAVAELLRRQARPAPGVGLGEAELRDAVDSLAGSFDPVHGGFGRAPKFPPATTIGLLLRCHARFGDERALEMARHTLDAMARGGMYDQIGGGFARYSTDERWLIPHFEKMLYDNALLARAYLEGSQATGDECLARVAQEVLDYVLREMTSPEGAFFSATDADSEGEEGRFFVWTPAEVEAVLGSEAGRIACAYWGIAEQGNFEGGSVPSAFRSSEDVAAALGRSQGEVAESIAVSRAKLYEARSRRVAPALDDKVLTSWNGLMIGAMAEGARVLAAPRYLLAAERAADFALGSLLRPDGRLLRTWRAGRAHLAAYLEDYAFLCEALVDLYEAGASERYLREALRLSDLILGDFAADGGGFYSTARDHERLIVRHREGHDGAVPAANAAAAHALARLSYHFDREDLRDAAREAIAAYGAAIRRAPHAFAKSLIVLDLLDGGPVELVFVGRRGASDLEALRREVGPHFIPHRVVAHHDPDAAEGGLPLLQGRGLVAGRAALYVCRGATCLAPVTEPDSVRPALLQAPPRRPDGFPRASAGPSV
jgi:uncharacterized protein YyaL (SSP411 family)